ncbi:hypothetical protein PTKIN_Ptkin04bG0206500 [Pterospermum kingtungense]
MASKATATIALILSLNLLFFSMTTNAVYLCGDVDVSVCGGPGLLGAIIPILPIFGDACCKAINECIAKEQHACFCGYCNLLNLDVTVRLNLLGICANVNADVCVA